MKDKSLVNILKDIYLFSFLDDDELEKLAQISSVHKYKKDSILFLEGEKSEFIYIIIDGLVSVYKSDEKANQIIIGFFKPYSLIAEAATLKKMPFPSSAVFKCDGAVVKVELEAFERDFLSQAKIAYEIIQSLLNKIQLLQKNIHLNMHVSAKEKILNFYKQNSDLAQELKKYELAAVLGMDAATFSRNLKQLIQENKLVKEKNTYLLI